MKFVDAIKKVQPELTAGTEVALRSSRLVAANLRGTWSTTTPGMLLDLAIITVYWLLFFWEILVRRDHFIPHDLLNQHYMYQVFIHQTLWAGEIPWWSPNVVSGYPIIADPLAALFYPPNLAMHLLLPRGFLPYFAMELQATLHFLWAAVGTYFLARRLAGSRQGAILAALVWAFGAFFAWHLPHLSPISTISWLPWILFAYLNAVHRRSPLWTAIAGAFFGAMLLAGHALTILQIGYLFAAVVGVVIWRQWRVDRKTTGKAALISVSVLALGTGLATVQLLPAYQLSSLTERADFSYEAASDSSFAPYWAVTAILPNFFSSDGPAPYWAGGDLAETNAYLGLLPLFLAALGVVRARGEDRSVTAILLAGALLGFVLAFGSMAWPYRITYDLLPGLDRVRRPGNFIAVTQFAVALLAAFGVKALATCQIPSFGLLRGWLWRAHAVLGVALLLTAVLLAGSIGRPAQLTLTTVLSGLVLALAIVLSATAVVSGVISRRLSLRVGLILLVLIAAIDLGSALAGKVYKNDRDSPNAYVGPTWASNPVDPVVPFLLDLQQRNQSDRFRIYPSNTATVWANGTLVWGLESATGYVGLCPRYYCDLLRAASADLNGPLLDLLNVRYLLTNDSLENAQPPLRADRFRLMASDMPHIYENTTAFPRIWVAREAIIQPADRVVDYLKANSARLRDVVVLSEPLRADAGADAAASVAPQGRAIIQHYGADRVVIHTDLASPGFVVLADTYYPGWSAELDGEPVHIYRANHAFRAVWVPAGEHTLEYRFTLPNVWLAGVISGMSLVSLAGVIAISLFLEIRTRTLIRDGVVRQRSVHDS